MSAKKSQQSSSSRGVIDLCFSSSASSPMVIVDSPTAAPPPFQTAPKSTAPATTTATHGEHLKNKNDDRQHDQSEGGVADAPVPGAMDGTESPDAVWARLTKFHRFLQDDLQTREQQILMTVSKSDRGGDADDVVRDSSGIVSMQPRHSPLRTTNSVSFGVPNVQCNNGGRTKNDEHPSSSSSSSPSSSSASCWTMPSAQLFCQSVRQWFPLVAQLPQSFLFDLLQDAADHAEACFASAQQQQQKVLWTSRFPVPSPLSILHSTTNRLSLFEQFHSWVESYASKKQLLELNKRNRNGVSNNNGSGSGEALPGSPSTSSNAPLRRQRTNDADHHSLSFEEEEEQHQAAEENKLRAQASLSAHQKKFSLIDDDGDDINEAVAARTDTHTTTASSRSKSNGGAFDSSCSSFHSARMRERDERERKLAVEAEYIRRRQKGYFPTAASFQSTPLTSRIGAVSAPPPHLAQSLKHSAAAAASNSSSRNNNGVQQQSSSQIPLPREGETTSMVVLGGATGAGTTCLVYQLASLFGVRVAECSPSVRRNSASLDKLVSETTQAKSINMQQMTVTTTAAALERIAAKSSSSSSSRTNSASAAVVVVQQDGMMGELGAEIDVDAAAAAAAAAAATDKNKEEGKDKEEEEDDKHNKKKAPAAGKGGAGKKSAAAVPMTQAMINNFFAPRPKPAPKPKAAAPLPPAPAPAAPAAASVAASAAAKKPEAKKLDADAAAAVAATKKEQAPAAKKPEPKQQKKSACDSKNNSKNNQKRKKDGSFFDDDDDESPSSSNESSGDDSFSSSASSSSDDDEVKGLHALVLMEAADIVADDEGGFHAALRRLADAAQCPVIVTASAANAASVAASLGGVPCVQLTDSVSLSGLKAVLGATSAMKLLDAVVSRSSRSDGGLEEKQHQHQQNQKHQATVSMLAREEAVGVVCGAIRSITQVAVCFALLSCELELLTAASVSANSQRVPISGEKNGGSSGGAKNRGFDRSRVGSVLSSLADWLMRRQKSAVTAAAVTGAHLLQQQLQLNNDWRSLINSLQWVTIPAFSVSKQQQRQQQQHRNRNDGDDERDNVSPPSSLSASSVKVSCSDHLCELLHSSSFHWQQSAGVDAGETLKRINNGMTNNNYNSNNSDSDATTSIVNNNTIASLQNTPARGSGASSSASQKHQQQQHQQQRVDAINVDAADDRDDKTLRNRISLLRNVAVSCDLFCASATQAALNGFGGAALGSSVNAPASMSSLFASATSASSTASDALMLGTATGATDGVASGISSEIVATTTTTTTMTGKGGRAVVVSVTRMKDGLSRLHSGTASSTANKNPPQWMKGYAVRDDECVFEVASYLPLASRQIQAKKA